MNSVRPLQRITRYAACQKPQQRRERGSTLIQAYEKTKSNCDHRSEDRSSTAIDRNGYSEYVPTRESAAAYQEVSARTGVEMKSAVL